MAGKEPPKVGGMVSASKFYAIKSGRIPGIYTDWPSAQAQIRGWIKPKHKSFSTRAEAQRFLDQDGGMTGQDINPKSSLTEQLEAAAAEPKEDGPAPKKTRKGKTTVGEYHEEDWEPGTGPLPPGAQDGFDPNIIMEKITGNVIVKVPAQRRALKLQAVGLAENAKLRVYTDGSSLKNGKVGAFAGVGVYFGPLDNRNISEALPGPRQTNQRAELTAISRALDTVPKGRDVTIVTDSRYSIDCVTVWYVNWRKNGWKTATGKAVENKDLVEGILTRIEDRKKVGSVTEFEWIKGHSGADGNVEADKLAVEGARKAQLNGVGGQ
jgi:ribonuclease HI